MALRLSKGVGGVRLLLGDSLCSRLFGLWQKVILVQAMWFAGCFLGFKGPLKGSASSVSADCVSTHCAGIRVSLPLHSLLSHGETSGKLLPNPISSEPQGRFFPGQL